MEQYIIKGGLPLVGEVEIGGAKNAALAIIAAAIMTDDTVVIDNLPDVRDINVLLDAMQEIGAEVDRVDRHTVKINGGKISARDVDSEFIKKIRASYYLIGALLGKYKEASVPLPGGCNIGSRPIDQHIKGFLALGADVEETEEYVRLQPGANGLQGGRVSLDVVSVGATMNIIMAACLLPGQTVIENAAKEPHIVDLANFLNTMGANISGAGTNSIKIRGVEALQGGTYAAIPDQIEAGTYMIAAAMTGGDVIVDNVLPEHQKPLIAKLREAGAIVEEDIDKVRVIGNGTLKGVSVKTLPYPGFPTDMQAQIMAMMVVSEGKSKVTETVFENRFMHVEELNRMGATITTSDRSANIEGPAKLVGCDVRATDLRAGAAMILAGLVAEGETRIGDLHHIDRGYEDIVEKLKNLGADIERVDV